MTPDIEFQIVYWATGGGYMLDEFAAQYGAAVRRWRDRVAKNDVAFLIRKRDGLQIALPKHPYYDPQPEIDRSNGNGNHD